MKVCIVEIGVPDSWMKNDVASACNKGLQVLFSEDQNQVHSSLGSPRGLASYVHVLSAIDTTVSKA
jgi:hypothetical protein